MINLLIIVLRAVVAVANALIAVLELIRENQKTLHLLRSMH